MPRKASNPLSHMGVKNEIKPGYHCAGDGLYLQVTASGSKSWIYRYRLHGRSREMGLGAFARDSVTLKEARQKRKEWSVLVDQGIDPIDERKRRRESNRIAGINKITFSACAEQYIDAHAAKWKNAKHVAQWRSTLATYANTVFGSIPVSEVDTSLVEKALLPIWQKKTETASRLRGRIESVLDWATVKKYRVGDNPARWRGHLDMLLPKPGEVTKVEHHPALPYVRIGAFMAKLRKEEGAAAKALEFTILTATRTSEVIQARWGEIDLAGKMFTIPAERMKAKREHRVPLSPPAIKLLKDMAKRKESEWVFPSIRAGRPLSNMAMLALLKRMKRADLTVHGFRSTFRDWAAEQTNFPSDVAEMALAHSIRDKTEAAYRRGELFDKRAKLMAAWAAYCSISQRRGNDV